MSLAPGAKGDSVRAMQQALNTKGCACPTNGIFDTATTGPLEAFQDSAGLTVQPVCDEACWAALGLAAAALPLSPGDKGPRVLAMQKAVVAKGDACPTTSVFDNATTAALEAFQDSAGLTVQPFCDAACWAALGLH